MCVCYTDKLYDLCGTPVYLAPEIYISGMFERSNPKCIGYSYPVDAWACGVIMFTLILGKISIRVTWVSGLIKHSERSEPQY